eukprot:CAMPEP_0206417148 /NCGR_PEP_ID=MMETSP0294-20121207/37162_1 /ASSEMBLY_ACC=CAM_ASM_000327 /TAXON_ID=39354 /ORGANISM="Heterosigma akashiwo, Strain CCMP2393" /LENGTH=81 /DNA_ID=CAMNT_0053879923 /DNA_START=159 /DNA_END=408 /DNA_ORIENTATION=-
MPEYMPSAAHMAGRPSGTGRGYLKGVVKEIVHESGRSAPLAKVVFKNPYRFQKDVQLMCAAEGMYSGMFIYCGKKATLTVL